MKNNLYIIKNSFQFMSSMEVIFYFEGYANYFLILDNTLAKEYPNIIVNESAVTKKHNIFFTDKSMLLKKFKKIEFDKIFTDDLSSTETKNIFKKIKFNELVKIDTNFINYTSNKKENIKHKHKNDFYLNIVNFILNKKIKKKFTYNFSIYEIKNDKNVNVIHSFENIKKYQLVSNEYIFEINRELIYLRKNISFNIDTVNRTLNTNVSIEKLRYITKLKNKAYVYPTAIKIDHTYEKNIINVLEEYEKLYLNKLDTDTDKIITLQCALIFLDEVAYIKILNDLKDCIKNRMTDMLVNVNNNNNIELKRFIGLLIILNQLTRFLFYSTNYFLSKKGFFIENNNFLVIYNLLLDYYILIKKQIKQKDRLTIENHLMWIFSHYAKYASYFNKYIEINDYLKSKKIQNVLRDKIFDILFFSTSYAYYKKDCTYSDQLKKYYYEYIIKKRYMESTDLFWKSVKIVDLLEDTEQIKILTKYFLENITIFNNEEKIKNIKVLIDQSQYFSDLKEELWLIFSDVSLKAGRDRLKAGLLLVEVLMKSGETDKAQNLFLKIYKNFKCQNQSEAVSYIGLLDKLNLLYDYKYIFEELYIIYIYKQFKSKLNVDTTRLFLIYQTLFSRLDKLKHISSIYNKILLPKATKLLKENSYNKIIFINPFNEMNNYMFPIHFYNALLDNKCLILNLEKGYIDFFNFEHEIRPCLLVSDNSSIYKSKKHWNDMYYEHDVDLSNKQYIINNINVFQGLYEQVSRAQKRFRVDWDSIPSKKLIVLFKRRMDRSIYVINKILKHKYNMPLYFFSTTSHFVPWSIYRDFAYKFNNEDLISFIHASPSYENYIHKMTNNRLITFTALNLRKYKKSRVAGLGGSEFFVEYANKNIIFDKIQETKQYIDIKHKDKQYYKIINNAKNQGKIIICILGKIVYDLAVPYMNGTFDDMSIWVKETAKFVSKRDDILLVVKPHPHEKNDAMAQCPNEYFSDFIPKVNNISNIYILDHYEAGLSDLYGLVDAFVLWNGTSVIELAKNRENIIVCDDWASRDYPIGIKRAKTQQEYFNLLINAKKWDRESDDAIKREKMAILYEEYLKRNLFYIENLGIIKSSTNVDWDNTYFDYESVIEELKYPIEEYKKILLRSL